MEDPEEYDDPVPGWGDFDTWAEEAFPEAQEEYRHDVYAEEGVMKLPQGAIRPGGWLRVWLDLERDGMVGRLDEVSTKVRMEGNPCSGASTLSRPIRAATCPQFGCMSR